MPTGQQRAGRLVADRRRCNRKARCAACRGPTPRRPRPRRASRRPSSVSATPARAGRAGKSTAGPSPSAPRCRAAAPGERPPRPPPAPLTFWYGARSMPGTSGSASSCARRSAQRQLQQASARPGRADRKARARPESPRRGKNRRPCARAAFAIPRRAARARPATRAARRRR